MTSNVVRKFFLKFLALPEGHRDARLRRVIDNVGEWLHEDMLSAVAYGFKRRDLHPSPNDVRQDEQEPMLFLGDAFAAMPGPLSAGA